MTAAAAPTLHAERELMREGFRYIVGMDEVGRGALAGPVSVGAVLIDAASAGVPAGVRDSKLLSQAKREALVDGIEKWCVASAVGHASPAEIDDLGITRALGLAGRRALHELTAVPDTGPDIMPNSTPGIMPDVVLLDGNADWLSGRGVQLGLLDAVPAADDADDDAVLPPVRTLVKADRTAASVAAASVVAKVRRDTLMARLAADFPHFEWQVNKGYGTATHRAMIAKHGPCAQHRRSWRLPSADPDAMFGADKA